MRILLFLLFGVVIGTIVGAVLPGRTVRGWITAVAVGAAGSMVGGLAGSALGLNTEGSRAGFAISALGAMTWLAIYQVLLHRAGLRGRDAGPPGYGRRSTDTPPPKSVFAGVERRAPPAPSSRS